MKKQSVALAILLLLTGCFQIDNAITLKNDLSGTADFHLGIDTPFEGLELVEKGDTITIRTKPQNPTEKVQEEAAGGGGPKMDADTEKMMKDAFSKMRVTYRITAPFKIVSHNGTRQEGQTLIWEYN